MLSSGNSSGGYGAISSPSQAAAPEEEGLLEYLQKLCCGLCSGDKSYEEIKVGCLQIVLVYCIPITRIRSNRMIMQSE